MWFLCRTRPRLRTSPQARAGDEPARKVAADLLTHRSSEDPVRLRAIPSNRDVRADLSRHHPDEKPQ